MKQRPHLPPPAKYRFALVARTRFGPDSNYGPDLLLAKQESLPGALLLQLGGASLLPAFN